MFSHLGVLLSASVALAVLAPVTAAQAAPFAAQFKLELFLGDPLDPFGDDIADAVGTVNVITFDAGFPDFADELTASIELAGVTYDYVGPDGFALGLNRGNLRLSDGLLSGPYPLSPDTVPALWFSTALFAQTVFGWQSRDCSTDGNGGFSCVSSGRLLCGYTLTPLATPIPLPASALLLPAALGALVALRRRRRA